MTQSSKLRNNLQCRDSNDREVFRRLEPRHIFFVQYIFGREAGRDDIITRFEIGNNDKVHAIVIMEVLGENLDQMQSVSRITTNNCIVNEKITVAKMGREIKFYVRVHCTYAWLQLGVTSR